MNMYGWMETSLMVVALLAVTKPMGIFMAHVYQGERTFRSPVQGSSSISARQNQRRENYEYL
jgi:K+-transporting ATPase ATPase A chain